jgi:hypothetical protein
MQKKTKIILICVAIIVVLGAIGSCNRKNGASNETATTTETTAVTTTTETTTETTTTEIISDNILMQADFKIDDVMTGDGKKKIGEYGYVEITKEQLESITMEEYDEFCNERVDGSGYNWVTIVCDDGTGICFAGATIDGATYCKLDYEMAIEESYGVILPNYDGTYTYYENED